MRPTAILSSRIDSRSSAESVHVPSFPPFGGDVKPCPKVATGENGRLVSVGERSGDRLWLVISHLWPFIGFLTATLPLVWLIPVVIWVVRKDDSPLIADQGRELINSMLTLLLLLCCKHCAPLAKIYLLYYLIVRERYRLVLLQILDLRTSCRRGS